jgi:hypothetical protein
LRHTFGYNYLNILGNDSATIQIYTQKSLGTLQDEIGRVQSFGEICFAEVAYG